MKPVTFHSHQEARAAAALLLLQGIRVTAAVREFHTIVDAAGRPLLHCEGCDAAKHDDGAEYCERCRNRGGVRQPSQHGN